MQLRLFLVHKGILLLAALLGLWLVGAGIDSPLGFAIIAYVILTLATLIVQSRQIVGNAVVQVVGYGIDTLLLLILIVSSGGLASQFWPLLVLQVLLPALYITWTPLLWIGAFGSGALYIAALWYHTGGLSFLFEPTFLVRYGVLFLSAITAAIVGERLQEGRRRQEELTSMLATTEAERDAQAKRLQRTAEDLGDRVLQLRSLQEIARALAATLDLPETLQVLANRMAVLADARYVAIALLDADGSRLRGVAATAPAATIIGQFTVDLADSTQSDLATLAAGNIVMSGEGAHLGFDQLLRMWQVDKVLCLPLVLRSQPIGALYIADNRPDFDTNRQRQLLDSFSYFAAAAVENAQLYQAVADKSQELETIMAGIGDGVLVVDADLRLVLMNPVATRTFSLDAPPPAGLPASLFLEEESLLTLLEEVRAQPDSALIREIELTPLGTEAHRTFQALATPLLMGTHLQGIATVLRDVTSQKELERMKSNFLSVVSHELKTPLHSIKGFVDIILMNKTGPVTEIQRDFLETVKQQTDHLQRMIDDLLEFSRLESGRVTLRLQPVDMPVVVEAAIDRLTPLAASAEVQLINQVPEDMATISADPWRLEQVVTNLVDNAIKFTPTAGQVTVSGYDLGDYLQIRVEDSGIGIAQDKLERIFDRFYQVDGGANRLYKGTGLGLTICRHIVEHHRGRIWAESAPGHGAAFVFTISKHLQLDEISPLDFTTLPEER